MPTKKTVTVRQGNTLRMPLAIKSLVNDVATPFDLTGHKLVFKAAWSGGTLRKATDLGTGFAITDAVNGLAQLELSFSETRAMVAGLGQYEIERQIGTDQFTLLYGDLVIESALNDD